MSNFFYMRVSTDGEKHGCAQSFDRQALVFKNAGYDLNDENTFAEHVSGGKSGNDRKKYAEMLSVLKPGDTVHVTETSRFARNYIAAMEMIDELTLEYECNIHFLSSGITLYAGEKLDPSQWLSVSILLLTDEYQRRCIGKATAEGLAAIRAKGKKLGRPSKDISDEEIFNDYANGMSQTEIADKYGVSVATVSRRISKRRTE